MSDNSGTNWLAVIGLGTVAYFGWQYYQKYQASKVQNIQAIDQVVPGSSIQLNVPAKYQPLVADVQAVYQNIKTTIPKLDFNSKSHGMLK